MKSATQQKRKLTEREAQYISQEIVTAVKAILLEYGLGHIDVGKVLK